MGHTSGPLLVKDHQGMTLNFFSVRRKIKFAETFFRTDDARDEVEDAAVAADQPTTGLTIG